MSEYIFSLAIARWLKVERVKRHMSMLDLERHVNIGHVRLTRYEANDLPMTAWHLAVLSAYFGSVPVSIMLSEGI